MRINVHSLETTNTTFQNYVAICELCTESCNRMFHVVYAHLIILLISFNLNSYFEIKQL